MPFLAPSTVRLRPLSFLLNDRTEPQKKVARHLRISLSTLQRYPALWFESLWEMPTLHGKAFNEAVHARPWVAPMNGRTNGRKT